MRVSITLITHTKWQLVIDREDENIFSVFLFFSEVFLWIYDADAISVCCFVFKFQTCFLLINYWKSRIQVLYESKLIFYVVVNFFEYQALT